VPTGSDAPDRVAVVTPEELHYAQLTNPRALEDPKTAVVVAPSMSTEPVDPRLRSIERLLEPGAFLLRNPFGANSYVQAAEYYEKLMVAKVHAFAEVCQKLGALDVRIVDSRHATDATNWHAAGKVQAKAVNASADVKRATEARVKQQITAGFTYQPRKSLFSFHRDKTDKAWQVAQALGIDQDDSVRSLIRQRSDPDYRLTKYSLWLEISTEVNRVVDATLNLDTILRRISPSIAAAFDRLFAQRSNYELKVEVDFSP
jgi:hypothetical protein